MAVYGVVYAVLENDIRRVLAYGIISQVGYMVAAVGIGTEMAINGATAHAFAHILYKGLLFMATGSVLFVTGRSKMTELGGLYRAMPVTFMLYMIGAFAISSMPLFGGFVSKSIVLGAAAESNLAWAWLLLMVASAGTFLYTGLKLPYFTFLGKGTGAVVKDAKEPPVNMLVGMGLAAFMCTLVGVYPKLLYNLLPYSLEYAPYTAEHVVLTLEILLLTWLGFNLYKKKLGGEAKISLDTDWFYRVGARGFMWLAERVVASVDNVVSNAYKLLALRASIAAAAGSLKFDIRVVDGLVNGVADLVLKVSQRLRTVQTGQLQHYALVILVGLFVLLNFVIFLS
jgi:multicomponent Na+:H+ antiporter subunit D